jgi:hypothetical protein
VGEEAALGLRWGTAGRVGRVVVWPGGRGDWQPPHRRAKDGKGVGRGALGFEAGALTSS